MNQDDYVIELEKLLEGVSDTSCTYELIDTGIGQFEEHSESCKRCEIVEELSKLKREVK
jgi:hypothetical protein